MANGECVVIVESSITSPSNIGIPYFLKLILKVDITKLELKKVMSGKSLLKPNLDYMSG